MVSKCCHQFQLQNNNRSNELWLRLDGNIFISVDCGLGSGSSSAFLSVVQDVAYYSS